MSTDVLDSLRFPIGKFQRSTADPAHRAASIEALRGLPTALRAAVSGLNDEQLATPYREGGWTVLQTVHHVADSHVNAYGRFRHGLTQDWPTIFAYDEGKWAVLDDARSAPISLSLAILDGLHARWGIMLDSLTDADFEKGFVHPEHGRQTLENALAMYSWHGRHHVAHITGLRERKGW
jgi:DinB superfamily